VIFAAALVGLGLVIQVVLGLVMEHFAHKEQRLDSLYPSRIKIDVDQFPNPRLEVNPAVDLARLKAEEARRIDAYGWVDRKAGIAYIPVERAMEILAETGLPRVPAPPPVAGAPPKTFIPPGTKRDEPGPATDQSPPAQQEKPRPQSKQGRQP
jgi:hypothetical protein